MVNNKHLLSQIVPGRVCGGLAKGDGDYFAWGETDPYYSSLDPLKWRSGKSEGYSWESYFDTFDGGASFYSYNKTDDGYKVLWPSWDAASSKWKGDTAGWRIPTAAEWDALRDKDNCDWTWTYDYQGTGVHGFIVTSKVAGYEGNSIFLPAAGFFDMDYYLIDIWGEDYHAGYYWAANLWPLDDKCAFCIEFEPSAPILYYKGRCYGFPVRAVFE